MKTLLFLFSFAMLCSFQTMAQWTVETVPDPKATGLGFVSNPDNILKTDEVATIDSLILSLEDTTSAQIAVVMLESIGGETPKQFATSLFNHWGVGDAETDNGLLILFVLDQRRIEFETGYGIEGILTDAKCYNIQQRYMVTHFKKGDYGTGMVSGVANVVNKLSGKADEIKTDNTNKTDRNETRVDYDYDNNHSSEVSFLFLYLKLVAGASGFFVLLLIISLLNKNYYTRYSIMRAFHLYIWFVLFPLPFAFLYLYTKKLTEKWRNTPRVSARTGKLMRKLNEKEDDKYLSSGQITEEIVKSIDYDVWISDEEGDVLIQAYKRWFTEYSSCPKCKHRTYHKLYDRVLQSATYTSSGRGEKKFSCAHCKHSKIVTYTIPQKTKSSSSSSSSSSSGGSSWGGGSSGGGGAGSSW